MRLSSKGLHSILLVLITFNGLSKLIQATTKDEKLLDQWAVHIDGGVEAAREYALRHGLILINQISSLKDYYLFKMSAMSRRKRFADAQSFKNFENNLQKDSSVKWIERQKVAKRVKRDYTPDVNNKWHRVRSSVSGVDPLWDETWYLNRHLKDSSLPDMNVTGAWSLGYSGRGVSVTFLDDGLEHDHPDLQQNYDPNASTDINNNDNDPKPRYDITNENKHGTRCAGEVAAVANNSICSTGVAFNARVGGIRMLDGDVTDAVEAASLSFNKDHIAIYSASWGPDDNGQVVDGPGAMAKQAFIKGVTEGRKGKGSIFVWASGNGGRYGDSCSCDGYANSIYTLSISSTSEKSAKPWYLEECTSTLATTYSSGDEKNGENEIVTTDINYKCTKKHTGTSAAAPLAAGIIALCLEANPSLTWRDVMYLTVLSSRPKAIASNNYIMNKRGFLVSSRYGFGLMDAGKMAAMAKIWVSVPTMRTCSTEDTKELAKTIVGAHNVIESIIDTNACEGTSNQVNFIEQVEIVVTIKTSVRGSLEIYLTSPSDTRSLILPRRSNDRSTDGFNKWSFMTVQLWGENPKGRWKLEIIPRDDINANLLEFHLNIHGTEKEPINYDSMVDIGIEHVSRMHSNLEKYHPSGSPSLERNIFDTVLSVLATVLNRLFQ